MVWCRKNKQARKQKAPYIKISSTKIQLPFNLFIWSRSISAVYVCVISTDCRKPYVIIYLHVCVSTFCSLGQVFTKQLPCVRLYSRMGDGAINTGKTLALIQILYLPQRKRWWTSKWQKCTGKIKGVRRPTRGWTGDKGFRSEAREAAGQEEAESSKKKPWKPGVLRAESYLV